MTQDLRQSYDALVAEGGLSDDPAQRAVLPLLQPIVDWAAAPQRKGLAGYFLRAPGPPKGLYLWGGVGRGKSMLMDLFIASVPGPKRRVHFHAFMQEIQSGLHESRRNGTDDALRPVAAAVADRARVLAFDEMQITDIADAMIVGRLFQMLFEAGTVIVTTSNRRPDDLYLDGLNRALFLPFIALLKERLIVHHLEAEGDYRQDRLAGETVWFTPADAAARTALDRLWLRLAGGKGEPLALPVKGRDVVLPEFRDGVARIGFWELCGQPLGPADYLALAGRVRVLILDGVPELSSENFNTAKRFVTLVDTLYEAGVRLIASAAAMPEKLYVEGEGSFEFARTASRLREMMSAGWGS